MSRKQQCDYYTEEMETNLESIPIFWNQVKDLGVLTTKRDKVYILLWWNLLDSLTVGLKEEEELNLKPILESTRSDWILNEWFNVF